MSVADMSDDEGGPSVAHEWQAGDGIGVDSPADSTKSDSEADEKATTDGHTQPIQKRRRVTRACDECRRKKIKCDGKQPCTHCSVYSYECTYDKPSNRRRNPAPQYIEALEGRLQRAETLLRKFMPEVDLSDPNLDPAVQQEFANRERVRTVQASKQRSSKAPEPPPNDAKLTSMIDSIGHLDIDEKGGWDFHGISSGSVFLRRMKDHFRGMLGPSSKLPSLPRAERPAGLPNLSSPSPAGGSPFSSASVLPELPSKEVARNLCYYSLSCATCLVRVVHVPTFYENFEKIYAKPIDNLDKDETQFLGLLYAVLALGCMYNSLDDSSKEAIVYREATDEGLKYYRMSRAILQDITECRDLTSLQALLFMILFLQATSNLSACYSYVGIALRSAMRMGLHRHLQHAQIGAFEQETRSRVFYVIRQMDIYVSTLLGFPLLLSKDDIDQKYPYEVDDEFISPQGILQPIPGVSSFFAAFNAHTRLMEILAKITKYVYPTKSQHETVGLDNGANPTYQISYGRIKEIEADLHEWYERLPEHWRPSAEGPLEVVRVRHLLRFAYAHVQLVLYRPFLHYVSPRLSQGSKVDEMSYACAAAAISVSRNIVHIGLEIRKQRVLSGPYWFMLYTEFFAVLSLVFYALENPDKPGSTEVLADAQAGRKMIADLAQKSQSADRVTIALKDLFDKIPEKLDQARLASTTSRKRPAPTNKSTSIPTHYPVMSRGLSNRRTEDLTASRSSLSVTGSMGSSDMRTPIDTLQSSEHTFQDSTSFTASMQDFMPVDMNSRATPESASTVSSQRIAYPTQPTPHNPVNKLGSLMFPSEDPFAYPNQPMMELGFQPKSDSTEIMMANQGTDSQFFMPGAFDEMDRQLLGQPPPYMIQQHHGQGIGLTAGMYDPRTLMNVQPTLLHHLPLAQRYPEVQQQQQQQQQQHHQQHIIPQRRQHINRHQERQIDQMFTEQGLQPDWGSFFGSGRGGFQGM